MSYTPFSVLGGAELLDQMDARVEETAHKALELLDNVLEDAEADSDAKKVAVEQASAIYVSHFCLRLPESSL